MARGDRRITEQSNPSTVGLDQLGPREILSRILEEDARVPAAVHAELDALTQACDRLHAVLASGGRWINVGAGTSGRLGLLDAAEIPPTFGLDPSRVQAVIAGGEAALTRAVEGAEDDAAAARLDLVAVGLSEADALVALSASGVTPYTRAAAEYAREVGAARIAITCAPDSPLVRMVEIPIVCLVGAEAITGSTRLKGGLAQKMVLHALSTAVMVRLGKVRGNLMTSLTPVNEKLRERAVTIVSELADCSPEEAQTALDAAQGSIEAALESLGR